MADVAHHTDFPALRAAAPAVPAHAGFWRRIYDSIRAAQRRRAECDVARHLALRNGKLTDSLEREIERQMFGEGWNFRR
jgi:hypothetical protein